MRKWITSGCSLVLLGCAGGSVANSTPQDSWGARADVLIVQAMAADAAAGKTSKNPLDVGLLAAAIGQRQGFESANADHYLDRLLAVQLVNGGFGFPYSFDSWCDGRVTPVGAAHTISMYQAGLALLPAYEAGVPGVEVALDRMVTKLASMPLVTVKPGKCMSYSDHPYDYTYGYCANNVNAAAIMLAPLPSVIRRRSLVVSCGFHPVRGGSRQPNLAQLDVLECVVSGSGPGTYGSDDQGTHECGSRHC